MENHYMFVNKYKMQKMLGIDIPCATACFYSYTRITKKIDT